MEKLKTAIAQLESKDGKDEENTKYISGIYEVTVPCKPDDDEDFEEYNLTMTVTIRDDKIMAITDITGDGDSGNDRYITKAANGTSNIKGVVSQIIDKGMPEDIDTVSRATCSSNAILEGCKKYWKQQKDRQIWRLNNNERILGKTGKYARDRGSSAGIQFSAGCACERR